MSEREKTFNLYLYLISRTFECIFGAYASLSQIEPSVYNLDVRLFALILLCLAKVKSIKCDNN